MEDETSPLFCDPLNSEEYTYSILSKTLAKKQPMTTQVAGAANQVRGAEGVSTAAHKAVHEGTWRGKGASRRSTSASRSGAASTAKRGCESSPRTDGGVAVEGERGEQEIEDDVERHQEHKTVPSDRTV